MQTIETPMTGASSRRLPDPTKRNIFYYGKLMDAYHFALETDYLNAKRWLLNRLVGGTGVVCGLDVHACGKNEISITPGLAIDKWGREILVTEKTPVVIPDDVVKKAMNGVNQQSRHQECCVQVLICYHECPADPSPVLTSECGCEPSCAPGAIRERFRIEFKPGCAPPIRVECPFPMAVSPGMIDYKGLAEWVTRARPCFDLAKDPCIPLANIPVDKDKCACHCASEEIDISIRPIVFYNRLLFNLHLCLEAGTTETAAE